MTTDDVRAQAVELLARLHGCAEWDDSQHDAQLKHGQHAAIVRDVTALADAGLLASPPVAWGIGLYPEDGGAVTVDESWPDRDLAVRAACEARDEFELDIRLYEIREGD